MKVLIVTSFFPPLNRMASSRPNSWLKYFSKLGWQVQVYTHQKTASDGPLNLDEATQPDRILEKKSFSFSRSSKSSRLASRICSKVERTINKLTWTLNPPPELKQKGSFDVVISTYSPIECHLIALQMKKRGVANYWIADYRDLWGTNPYRKRECRACTMFERIMLKHADLITVASQGFGVRLRETSAPTQRIVTIENGFNTSLIDGDNTLVHDANVRPEEIVLLHSGTVYTGKRDPSALFQAVSELLDEGLISRSNFKLIFLGDRIGNCVKLAETHSISDIVETPGQVSRKTSIAMQARATGLILLNSGDPLSEGIITGKVYEYIAANKPILGIGFDEKNAAGRLILKTKTGLPLLNDVQEIKRSIQDIISNQHTQWFNPDTTEINKCSRDSQASLLSGEIEALVRAGK